MRTYDNIRKISGGQGDDHTTCCLLDYNYFNNYFKIVEIVLIKQQALDADLKAIQQISFTLNLDQTEGETVFLIIKEAKETT